MSTEPDVARPGLSTRPHRVRRPRQARAEATRELLLDTAERLFAEHGLHAVSNRQIGEAAGQGNTAVVGYHFGTRADLIRAVVERHAGPIQRIRMQMLADITDSAEVREWVACLVEPITEHLGSLGLPTWFSRCAAQLMADPGLRSLIVADAVTSEDLQRLLAGLNRCLPDLPPEVWTERSEACRHLIMQVLADREHALAEGRPTARPTWAAAASGLVDILVGVWLAPITPAP